MAPSGSTSSSRSIARDLTLGLSLTVLVVVLLTVGVSYMWSAQRSLAALNAEADDTIERIALALAQPLWVINLDDVAQIGRVFSAQPNIVYLQILGEDGTQIFAGSADAAEATRPDSSDAIYRTTPILYDNVQIGTVHLAMANATLVPQQQQYISSVVLFAIVLAVVTLLVLLFLMRRLLVSPLQALTQSLHSIAEGSYHRIPHFGVIETDNIGDAFNKMVDAISTRDRALLNANATLEAQVEARTQKLQATNQELDQLTQRLEAQNTLLEQQNTTLEARNAEMERFTYTVSHDLKSPLVTIKGFLGLIKKSAAANDIDQLYVDLKQVSRAADHMHELLNDLLQLSRVGRLVAPFESVPLRPIIEDVCRNLQGSIAATQATITIQPDLPEAWGDRARIREVFQNLIENALKFTRPEVSPAISVEVSPEGNWLHCVVRDAGIGIPEKYHDTVFGLFERLDAETEGTGVGLALVKRIVEYHHGRIWVICSAEEEGTAFHFTLPATGGEEERERGGKG